MHTMTQTIRLLVLLTCYTLFSSAFAKSSHLDDHPLKGQKTMINVAGDTAIFVCGSTVNLVATGGSAYSWSTGSTNSQITATGSNSTAIYWVNVTTASGVRRDSIWVSFSTTPTQPTTSNISRCGPGNVTATANGTAQYMLWFPFNSTIPVWAGNSYTFYAPKDTNIFVTAANGGRFKFAPDNISFGTSQAEFATYSLKFNASQSFMLDTVHIFMATTTAQYRVSLTGPNGFYREKIFTLSLGTNPKTPLDLGFWVPQGNGYDLRLASLNSSASKAYVVTSGVNYGYKLPSIVNIFGTSAPANYYPYFFDWRVWVPGCQVAMVQVAVDVKEAPVVNPYTVMGCGTSGATTATLDALAGVPNPNPTGTTYSWAPASGSASSLTVTLSGLANPSLYTVYANNPANACKDTAKAYIYFATPVTTAPVAPNVTRCGAGPVTLSATGTGQKKIWYGDAAGTNMLHVGDNFSFLGASLTADSMVWVAGVNGKSSVRFNPAPDMTLPITTTNSGSGSGNVGTVFDVYVPIVIDSVFFYPRNATTGSTFAVELQSSTGKILDSVVITMPLALGKTGIALNFAVNPGSGYRLVYKSLVSATAYFRNSGTTYPYTIPGTMSITGTTNNVNTNFNYLFDWRIFIPGCVGPKDQATAVIAPKPDLNLSSYTIGCGSNVVLNPNPTPPTTGLNYSWSPGNQTTSTITVSTPGNYSVTCNYNGNVTCATTANTTVSFAVTPNAAPTVNSVVRCGPGAVTLTAINNATNVASRLIWYKDLTPGNDTIINVGSTYALNATATTSAYVTAVGGINSSLGPNNYNLLGTGIFSTGTQGLMFDVDQAIILDTVSVYFKSAGYVSFKVQIRNSSGTTILQEKSFAFNVITAGAKMPLYLGFTLNPSQNYRLVYQPIFGSTQLLFNSSGATYPYQIPNIISIKKNTNTNVAFANAYYYFYDWKVYIPGCETTRKLITATINDKPDANLPAVLDTCSNSVILNPNVVAPNTLSWSPGGQTTPTKTVTNSGTYTVYCSNPSGCKDTASVFVNILQSPSSPSVNNTVSQCGAGVVNLAVNSPNPSYDYIWYGSPTGTTIEYVSTSYPINVLSATSFTKYVSSSVGVHSLRVGRADNLGSSLATAATSSTTFNVSQPIIIDSVYLYLSTSGLNTFTISLQIGNATLQSKYFANFAGVSGRVAIPLFFGVAPGTGYRLTFSPTNSTRCFYNLSGNTFPYAIAGIINITGTTASPAGSNLNAIFYDWRISTIGCESPRVPITVNVQPVANLCNPAVLTTTASSAVIDAGTTPNATYAWTPSGTGSTKTVTSSGAYTVTATLSGSTCSVSATTNVTFITAPVIPVANDVVVCDSGSAQTVALTATSSNADVILWYANATSTTVQAVGGVMDMRSPTGNDTTVYVAAAKGAFPTTPVGPVDSTMSSTAFIATTATNSVTYSTVFRVQRDFILEKVYVYPKSYTGTSKFYVDLVDDLTGIILQSRYIQLTGATGAKTAIPLGFYITGPSSGACTSTGGANYKYYRLALRSDFDANMRYNKDNATYPYALQGIMDIIGNKNVSNPNHYYFFYDWKVFIIGASSTRNDVFIDFKKTPVPTNTGLIAKCPATNQLLCAGAPGATYTWTLPNGTTQNTQCILANVSGLYDLEVSYANSQCKAFSSSVLALGSSVPLAPIVQNQQYCSSGEYTLTATNPAGSVANNIFWYEQGNPVPIYAGNDYTTVIDTELVNYTLVATYGARGKLGPPSVNVGAQAYSGLPYGTYFDVPFSGGNSINVVIDSVAFFPYQSKANFFIELRDASNNVKWSKFFNLSGLVAGAKTWLKLGLVVPSGDNYQLRYSAPFNTYDKAYLNTNGYHYPYTLNGIISLKGSTNNNLYPYLYDWRIYFAGSTCVSPSSNMAVNIILPVDLDSDNVQDGEMRSCTSIQLVGSNNTNATRAWYSAATGTTNLCPNCQNYTVNASGKYWLVETVSTPFNCSVSDTVEVTISPDVGLPDDGVLCGSSLVTSYGYNPPSTVTFSWNTGATTPSINVSQAGIYYVTVFENGCPPPAPTDTINVTGFDVPPTSALLDTVGCGTIVLDPDANGLGLSYAWSPNTNNATTPTVPVTTTGIYFVEITNASGCIKRDTAYVTVLPSAAPSFNMLLSGGTTVSIQNTTPFSSSNTYSWSFSPSASPSTSSSPNPPTVTFATPCAPGVVNTVTLCVTNSCGVQCASNNACTISIEDEDLANPIFHVYPNPADNQLFIDMDIDKPQTVSIELYDLTGKAISQQNVQATEKSKHALNVSHLPQGIYLLKVRSESHEEVFKMMIE